MSRNPDVSASGCFCCVL